MEWPAARLVDGLARCALDEPRLAYNRVLLSSVRAGETAPEDIELKRMSGWRDRGVTLTVGCPATEIDVGRREIKIANDESVSFSRLGWLRCAWRGSSHPANLPLKHRERHRSNSTDVQRPASTR